MVECLEPRIVPAAVFTYTDIDGDKVTVTSSKGDPALLAAAASFSDGLLSLDLSNTAFQGTNLSIVATRDPAAGGDGFVNVRLIDATGRDLGIVKVAGDLQSIKSGDGISSTPALKSLVAASVAALESGSGTFDGRVIKIVVPGDFNALFLANDSGGGNQGSFDTIRIGGSVPFGSFEAANSLKSIKVGGSFGGIYIKAGDDLGTVVIGDGANLLAIESGGTLGSVHIGGNLGGTLLGNGQNTGTIHSAGAMGKIFIGGDLRSFGVLDTGRIVSESSIASITIGGSIIGGAGSGFITAEGDLGPVKISRDLDGRSGGAWITSTNGSIASVQIGGSILGGDSAESGRIFTGEISGGSIGSVKIGRDVIGGPGTDSAEIVSRINLGPVYIGGSLIGGRAEEFDGPDGDSSAQIIAGEMLKSVTIAGNILGGSGTDAAAIRAFGVLQRVLVNGSIFVSGGDAMLVGTIHGSKGIGTVTVLGQLFGSDLLQGAITSNGPIGSILVNGPILTNGPLVIAHGSESSAGAKDVAIGKITFLSSVTGAEILAGFKPVLASPFASNADAQIGSIVVGGAWTRSSIVAGVTRGADDFYGSLDDVRISGASVKDTAIQSRIGSVTIKGQANGDLDDPAEFSGIVAEHIGKLKVGGTTYPFTSAPNEIFRLGSSGAPSGNFFAREDV